MAIYGRGEKPDKFIESMGKPVRLKKLVAPADLSWALRVTGTVIFIVATSGYKPWCRWIARTDRLCEPLRMCMAGA
jgi:hypothetical protein